MADQLVVDLLSMAKKQPTRRRQSKSDYQVFISHATTDRWLATTLCEKVELTGASTFRDDRDIRGGDDIPDTIVAEIKRSKEFLLLLTPDSIDRPWVLLETGVAWGWRQKMVIVSVLCHVSVAPIPAMLKSKKAVPLNEFDQYSRARVLPAVMDEGRITIECNEVALTRGVTRPAGLRRRAVPGW